MKSEPKNKTKAQQYEKILGVKITSTPKVDLLAEIQEKLLKKQKFTIFTPNPEILLKASSDSNYKSILNSADYLLPDGVGLKLAKPNLNIIKGREFMRDLFVLANNNKLKVYLLGSTDKVIEKSLQKIKHQFPNITIKGDSGPLMDNNGNSVSEVNINISIDAFKPDLLFVAFGAPKQELWVYKYKDKLNATGIMVIGGALDTYSGIIKDAPVLLANLGLEWLWRLIQEPKRIVRIFNAVIIFPIKLALDRR